MSLDLIAPTGLRPEDVRHVATVGHRLAMGVQWIDALSGQPVNAGWVSELQAVGMRPWVQRFDLHAQGRHAVRHAGRLAKLLTVADAENVANPPASPATDPTNLVLRAFGQTQARAGAYAIGNDPRRYVPRRLAVTPVMAGGLPAVGLANIRTAWLWPGSIYPLPAKATALRGRIRRGGQPLAWARVVVTRTNAPGPDVPAADQLAVAHGDERGEFLAVLGASAVPGGAALPATLSVRLWLWLPPALPAFDAAEPLASLPLEVAGTANFNDVLRGAAMPPGYLVQGPIDVTLPPGSALTVPDALLAFP